MLCVPRGVRSACLIAIVFINVVIGAVIVVPVRSSPVCRTIVWYPRVPLSMCPEKLIEYGYTSSIESISALTFGPDGSLYYARPATSQIIRLKPDANGFLLAPSPALVVFAANLPEPPNGLTYFDNAFYVSGDTTITRLSASSGSDVADEQQVIMRDLPGGVGGWLGNIRVGPDKHLYVAKGASCDNCKESDPRRAALLSFALDGSDPRIVASGLPDSYDFGWQPGSNTLFIADNEPAPRPGTLKMISTTGGVKSAVMFEPGSHPTGVAFYNGDAFPEYKGKLLVALSGSWNTQTPAGYQLVAVSFDANGEPNEVSIVLPARYADRGSPADALVYGYSFYPDHLVGIAVSKEGWIYLSSREGHIYRFRPAD